MVVCLLYCSLLNEHYSLCDRIQLGISAVSAACKNTRSSSTYKHTGLLNTVAKLGIRLPENICRLDVREYKAISIAGNRALKLLDLNSLFINSNIKGKRTVTNNTLDLTTIAHLSKHSSLHASRHTVKHLLRSSDESDLRLSNTEGLSHTGNETCNLNLLTEVRLRDNCHIGKEHELVVVGVLNDTNMAQEALRRQKSALFVKDGAKELVS